MAVYGLLLGFTRFLWTTDGELVGRAALCEAVPVDKRVDRSFFPILKRLGQ